MPRSLPIRSNRILICGLALLGACSGGTPASDNPAVGIVFGQRLEAVVANPADALVLCAELEDAALHGECLTVGAEELAATRTEDALTFCERINSDLERDECFFQVAERSRDASICERCGAFAEDCRMHAWTRQLRRNLPEDAVPGALEADISELVREAGFSASDPRPWVALYRIVLGEMRPMVRSACDRIDNEDRLEICRSTGLVLFHDRLNHLRDTLGYPCDTDHLPDSLNTRLDDELAEALASRMETDLCP